MQIVKDMLHIEALPKDLPKEIEVDLSVLKELHDVIFIKDLKLPKGVVSKDDGETALVTVTDLANQSTEEDVSDTEEKTTKECPFCKSEIAITATRCPHCTSKLEGYKDIGI